MKVFDNMVGMWVHFSIDDKFIDINNWHRIGISVIISIQKAMYSKKETPKITVIIRKRPLSKKEIAKGETDIIRIPDQSSVLVSEIK